MLKGERITEIIKRRFSCRTYVDRPIEAETRGQLEQFLSRPDTGPFGTPTRFQLVATTNEGRDVLKGLGTYGFIRGATGFIVGTVQEGVRNLEDFGYRMEEIVLFATALDLGTCWLGGTFTRSSFAERIGVDSGESMPAITAVGYIAEQRSLVDRIVRRGAQGTKRYSWQWLFYDGHFGQSLSYEAAGAYALPLEMVRLGPSASNKQPWRVVRDSGGGAWHFYLQRSQGYRSRNSLVRVADMQRLDLGIAMSHFELTARDFGLEGQWVLDEPDVEKPDELTEYTATWLEARSG